ncbi:hypothetical protein EIN_080200 [Entamoeba invadens IP1]|uniref:hypothetical protein n=1 Tax=Entamoeba invadens IP1 TaxID=370355 RepID=UPI0002C3D991|nr:hypothetical protein EIN_080200 [Entamoeba invadens IP1]ELP85068.1 hypothetical protein EIN_080200 [Entamoeba invadens IP1]|eukprot:XP_004184414.1 hypothetical protein EIN_080200 [Entamoeba invadens IP1]
MDEFQIQVLKEMETSLKRIAPFIKTSKSPQYYPIAIQFQNTLKCFDIIPISLGMLQKLFSHYLHFLRVPEVNALMVPSTIRCVILLGSDPRNTPFLVDTLRFIITCSFDQKLRVIETFLRNISSVQISSLIPLLLPMVYAPSSQDTIPDQSLAAFKELLFCFSNDVSERDK